MKPDIQKHMVKCKRPKFIDGPVLKNSDTTIVKHMENKHRSSKTYNKMHKSTFIDEAVVKNSDTTIVKHMENETRPSKTHSKL